MGMLKKLLNGCLAHPCWSGVSGIVGMLSLLAALKWPVADASQYPVGKPGIDIPLPPDLAGKWIIDNTVTTSTYKAFVGLDLRYLVGIAQTDGQILVSGEKDSERKGKATRIIYEKSARTKFSGKGELRVAGEKRTIQLDVTEGGVQRPVKTTFNLVVIDSARMEGAFSSDAASSTGDCVWRRDSE